MEYEFEIQALVKKTVEADTQEEARMKIIYMLEDGEIRAGEFTRDCYVNNGYAVEKEGEQ